MKVETIPLRGLCQTRLARADGIRTALAVRGTDNGVCATSPWGTGFLIFICNRSRLGNKPFLLQSQLFEMPKRFWHRECPVRRLHPGLQGLAHDGYGAARGRRDDHRRGQRTATYPGLARLRHTVAAYDKGIGTLRGRRLNYFEQRVPRMIASLSAKMTCRSQPRPAAALAARRRPAPAGNRFLGHPRNEQTQLFHRQFLWNGIGRLCG